MHIKTSFLCFVKLVWYIGGYFKKSQSYELGIKKKNLMVWIRGKVWILKLKGWCIQNLTPCKSSLSLFSTLQIEDMSKSQGGHF